MFSTKLKENISWCMKQVRVIDDRYDRVVGRLDRMGARVDKLEIDRYYAVSTDSHKALEKKLDDFVHYLGYEMKEKQWGEIDGD
jgi:hypothetical protein